MTNLNDKELIQHIANAMHTGAMCGGHQKAAARGLTVPETKTLYAMGIFNGPGSV